MNVDVIGPVLITGATGMLGQALTALCEELGVPCSAYSETQLDITDAAAVSAAVGRFAGEAAAPGGRGLAINAAAYTDVERAEDDEERAFAVNDAGARNIAEAAARHRLGLIHVSTDFVFDGSKHGAYTEADDPNPLNAYGRSKLAGERSVMEAFPEALLVRTAWVYGPGGNNFPRKIVELARTRTELQVVADETGCPTATADLARGILELWGAGAKGLFHVAGYGSCSRFEMAEEIVAAAGSAVRVTPVPRGTFPTRAMRPANSVLCVEKARRAGVELPCWRDSLKAYVRGLVQGTDMAGDAAKGGRA
jgi:dTDP-4-dehydrorhamnose reductase